MADEERIRILVVGDSGVGKSALLSHLCSTDDTRTASSSNSSSSNTTWTIGCNVFVKAVETKGVDGSIRKHFVEFIDVGGHNNYRTSRQLFYGDLNGVIFVYDLTNIKSFHNLRKWMEELVHANRRSIKGGLEESVGVTLSPSGLRHGRHMPQTSMDRQPSFGSQNIDFDQSLDSIMGSISSDNNNNIHDRNQLFETSNNRINNCDSEISLVNGIAKHKQTDVTQRQNKGKHVDTIRIGDGTSSPTPNVVFRRGVILGTLPAIVIGTKSDLLRKNVNKSFSNRGTSSMSVLPSLENMNLSAVYDRVEQWSKLVPFLHRVVDHRYFPNDERTREANTARMNAREAQGSRRNWQTILQN